MNEHGTTTATPRVSVAIDSAEARKFLDGLLGPVGHPETMAVELGAVRRMALAIEDPDPIHYDRDAALRRGYRGIVAPWPFLWLLFFNCSDYHTEFPFGKATVHGQDDYEFHEPIVVGDEITVETQITNWQVKHGKSGPMALVLTKRLFTNQRSELCSVLTTTSIRR